MTVVVTRPVLDLADRFWQWYLSRAPIYATVLGDERYDDRFHHVSRSDATHAQKLNALAAVDSLVGLDQVVRIVKLTGFVASAAGFTGQPAVINGASDLFGEVFGEAGRHARSAVGVAELPLDAPVEVEVIVEVA